MTRVLRNNAVISPSPTEKQSKKVFLLGEPGQAGAYVLRIRVHREMKMAFGGFKRRKQVLVTANEYCYVGSALCEKGPVSLARRLVRHATRTEFKPPHPLREEMQFTFHKFGMGEGDLRSVHGKKLYWHVDYLLDDVGVDLVAAYVVRSSQNIEAPLGKLLEQDPSTVVFERGLGASDIPGNTHLLRVDAIEEWWQSLPAKLLGLLHSQGSRSRSSTSLEQRTSTVRPSIAGGGR